MTPIKPETEAADEVRPRARGDDLNPPPERFSGNERRGRQALGMRVDS